MHAPSLLTGALLLLAGCASTNTLTPSSPGQPTDVFLLAGQSNMAGRGDVAAQDTLAHPRVLMFTADGRWAPAVDPMHFDKPVAGVGPGRAFGIALAERDPQIVVGLIPAAVGGSPIETWTPGAVHEQTGAHPWDDALDRTRRALAGGGELRAILWHQGESDSHPERAPRYQARLDSLIARFRETLDDPDLPFIVGQLGRFDGRPWDARREQVNRAHETLPDRVPHTAFVTSQGLTPKPDSVHFDAASARTLGRRYADTLLQITSAE